ncbi:MAG: DUF3237 domain-containing protein [Bryobacterales bacterium]|nr:DUF3237 domain-containing protein [Bryobacterales bacterium]
MLDYKLEHIVSYKAQLAAPPEVIGPVPQGIRVNAYVAGGEAFGPTIKGKVLPLGADWATLQTDGILILDVRATIETDDGALILVTYNGMGDFGESGYQDFLAQKLPSSAPLRINPRFWTAHPKYAWLNRTFCVGIGALDSATFTVSYDVYAVK